MKTFNRKLIASILLGATLAPLTIVLLAGCGSGASATEGVEKGDTVVNRKDIGPTNKGKQLKEKADSQ